MKTQNNAVTNDTNIYNQNSRSIRFSIRIALFGLLILSIFAGFYYKNNIRTIQSVQTNAASPVLRGKSALAHLKQNGSFDSLDAAVTSARYNTDAGQNGVTAQNDANDLRMNFTASGLQLSSTAKENSWRSDWQLSSLGYGSDQRPVASGDLQSHGNRVELKRRKQSVTEWFENSPAGVEHGFTVASRPVKRSSGDALRLVISLDGDLTPKADADGQALTLVKSNGENALRYENLKVWDAEGKYLTAQMRTDGRKISFDVDDASAAYPITIDPTFIQLQKTTAADGVAEDQFGGAVAVSGNTAIIGSSANNTNTNSRSGAAYVFLKTGTTWTLQQKLTASDGQAGNSFGWSVAIDVDTAVVGAYGDNIGANAQQGSAYVFVRSGTTWTQQAKLTASDGTALDLFGASVGISGDTIAVGASSDDVGLNSNQGSAYIFVRNGVTWPQQQKLTAADGSANDYFGDSVAIAGDTVIIGATEDKTGANTQQGSAYVFVTTGTTWTQQQKLTAADGAIYDFFGFSVAISGNTAVVGTLQNVGANAQQGSAYVFVRSGTTWTQQQKLLASDGSADASFGGSVAILGDRAIIGAFGAATGANTHQGSAYIFNRTGTVWTQQQKLLANDGAMNAAFGAGVALSADTIVIGAMTDTTGANQFQGSTYFYVLGATVSGKVTTADGSALRGASVTITDSQNVRRSVFTNNFGNYSFDSVRIGESYVISVVSKRFRFAQQPVPVTTDLTGINFAGLE